MNKKVLILSILTVLLSITIAVGFSYAIWTQTKEQEDANELSVGCLDIQITKQASDINLANAYPITDDDGKKLVPFTFTIKNNCTFYAHFSLNLEKLSNSDMEDQYIKLQLNNRRPQLYSAYNSETPTTGITSRSLDFGGLEPNMERDYTLRLWIDYDATVDDVGGKTFQGKVVVNSVAAEPTGAEYIENLLVKNTNTMNNDDPDENVRYMGASPNNYVKFNDELWRIIGVFYVKSSDNGPYEKRLKIIRNESIGRYSWNSSESSVNGGGGVNEWSVADLNLLLNETYYNSRSSTNCYNGLNNAHITCDFTNESDIKGLNTTAQNMIENALWNTGTTTNDWSNVANRIDTAFDLYLAERSSNNGKYYICSGSWCNDNVLRTTTWVGKVALMYPSDYGYATGGSSTGRSTCLVKAINKWNETAGCYQDDWLFNNRAEHTITPSTYKNASRDALFLNSAGNLHTGQAGDARGVWPVVYLKSSVQIADDGMDGSSDKPYNLVLE